MLMIMETLQVITKCIIIIIIRIGIFKAHLAAREGHLMCLKYLLCSHGNIMEAIYDKNNMVLLYYYVFKIYCLLVIMKYRERVLNH